MADQISICNMALAEIVAEPIQSLQERSLGARECARSYPQALATLLEAHPWGFAIKRSTLAPTVNTRIGEWTSSFALPVDVARPVKVVPSVVAAAAPGWWYAGEVLSLPYAIEAGIIYCACTDAVLAYVASAITADAFPARFVDALVLELATRLVMPIKKSREMKGDLLRQAEVAKQRAMADDINRQPPVGKTVQDEWVNNIQACRDGAFVSESYWGGW